MTEFWTTSNENPFPKFDAKGILDNFKQVKAMLGPPPLYTFPIPVHVVESLDRSWKQVKFPKSKKKRIRRKWRNQRKNWGWVYDDLVCYFLNPPPMAFGGMTLPSPGPRFIVNPPMLDIIRTLPEKNLAMLCFP